MTPRPFCAVSLIDLLPAESAGCVLRAHLDVVLSASPRPCKPKCAAERSRAGRLSACGVELHSTVDLQTLTCIGGRHSAGAENQIAACCKIEPGVGRKLALRHCSWFILGIAR